MAACTSSPPRGTGECHGGDPAPTGAAGGWQHDSCPPSPRLRPLDLEFMRRLSKIVNVVPVIAKADTLTLEEREEFKQRVRGGTGGAPGPPAPLLWSGSVSHPVSRRSSRT